MIADTVAARNEFVDDLFGGRAIGTLAERAERYGLRLPGSQVVAVARGAAPVTATSVATAHVEAGMSARFDSRDVLVCTKDGLVVCLTAEHRTDVIDELARLLTDDRGDRAHWRMGIGRAESGPSGAARSFEQARTALDIGERLDLPERVLYARDLLVYQVLRRDQAALAELVTDVLDPLRNARIGTVPLLETLYAYFVAGGVSTVTARSLGVAVRTVTYRLQRVKELTGYAADDPEQAFTLQTAVFGARLIGWPGGGDDA
jgi:sugar diacid utilization regulator